MDSGRGCVRPFWVDRTRVQSADPIEAAGQTLVDGGLTCKTKQIMTRSPLTRRIILVLVS
jgi:hypothetical protein